MDADRLTELIPTSFVVVECLPRVEATALFSGSLLKSGLGATEHQC